MKTKPSSKKTKHKPVSRRSPAKGVSLPERAPEYMVQISDPKTLRKDILESLREVVLFMQSYEKFRKIQEEKITLFSSLKVSVKELSSLIDCKLRSYLPKGKLLPVTAREKSSEQEAEEPAAEKIVKASKSVEEPVEEYHPRDSLEELETQLSDIEAQLKKLS